MIDPNAKADLATKIAALIAPAIGRHLEPEEYVAALAELKRVRYDSATAFECIALLEDTFGFEADMMSDDFAFHLRSVSNMAGYVEAKVADSATLQGSL